MGAGHLRHRRRRGHQRPRRGLQADAAHRLGQGIAGHGGKDAVKVTARQRRHLGQFVKRQIGRRIAVDPAMDPFQSGRLVGAH